MKTHYKFLLLTFLIFNSSKLLSQNFNYTESFETSNPFVSWTSNATYTINYFGPSSDRYVDGTKSLKMDITVNGNGTNECYYYWKLPLKINLHGTLNFSSQVWMDQTTAAAVKFGYYYGFPPTGLERLPTPPSVTTYNSWYTQSVVLSQDVLYHADYFAKNKMYSATRDDFGRELEFIALTIKAKGSNRFVFYIDKLEVSGTVLSTTDFTTTSTQAWNNYQLRVDADVATKHTAYNNLTPLPDTSHKIITSQGLIYYNNLKSARTNMSSLLTTMDNAVYFAPTIMDSMNSLLGLYPTWYNLLQNEISNPGADLQVFTFPATVYNRLDEKNQPGGLTSFDKLNVKACSGEAEPLTILLQAQKDVNNITLSWTDFAGSGRTISSSALDISIAKVWYQAGLDEYKTSNKYAMQELLVKNDSLVKVDFNAGINYLQVTNSSGVKSYIDITTSTALFPTGVIIADSPTLLPFKVAAGRNKQLWLTFRVPAGTPAGIYTSQLTIRSGLNTVRTFPVEIEVYPFSLDESRIAYGIYYHGYLDNYTDRPFYYSNKKDAQLRIELTDILEHGIKYPTCYQSLNNLDGDLQIRRQIGLPTDKFYTVSFSAGNPQTQTELDALKTQINNWKTKLTNNGFQDLHVYGIDEATGTTLTSQRPAWQAVHDAGAKVFVAGYQGMADAVGDLLDVGVILGGLSGTEANKYHNYNHKIYSYSNPQVGYENPEIYRRNYGFSLLLSGYDGAMDYAYQKNYGAFWNDWDGTKYREQNFTYPVTNGIISTIQWEGFREAIDDVKYLSTLLNLIDKIKARGGNASSFEQFVNSINTGNDLDNLRKQIAQKIIEASSAVPPPDVISPTVVSANLVNPNSINIIFSESVTKLSANNPANYSITPGITVSAANLGSDNKTVTITTTQNQPYVTYKVLVGDVYDLAGNRVSSANNSASYSFKSSVKVKAKIFLQGPYSSGSMSTKLYSSGLVPKAQPYNLPPWNYKGNESVSTVPVNVVDWILVELRSETSPATVIKRKAAFISSNGSLINLSGEPGLTFDTLLNGKYYVAFKHRNHLPIMTARAIYLSDTTSVYDFTKSGSGYGTEPLVNLGSNIYGLYAGDSNANGVINQEDMELVANSIFKSGYKQTDIDLNKTINVLDYGKVKNSLSKTSQVP